jgi:hypothetical protein
MHRNAVTVGGVTWVPLQNGAVAERDALLGLVPEPYAILRRALAATWHSADPRLLEVCRLRLAQLVDARAELAGADERLLAELSDWESSAAFTETERAALAFADQYHYDHNSLSEEQKAELKRRLPATGEVLNFVWALHMNDAYIRVLRLLDVAPDPPDTPPRPERGSHAETHGSRLESVDPGSLMARDFRAAYLMLGPAVVKQSLVDEVTSEAIRLHNASHQHCLY